MYKYRNSHINYVKQLFADNNITKAKGKLVAISNGGYGILGDAPDFGYRIYFDKTRGAINCQVISAVAKTYKNEYFREYTVLIGGAMPEEKIESVQTAILYAEYRHRTLLNMR